MSSVSFGGGAGASAKRQRLLVQVYRGIPEGELCLQQVEQFALDRKSVLEGINNAFAKGLKSEELRAQMNALLQQYLPLRNNTEQELQEDLFKDKASHDLLSFIYSKNKELHRWFVQQEDRLFKHRFNVWSVETRAKVICELRGDAFQTITQEHYETVQEHLLVVFGWRDMNMHNEPFSREALNRKPFRYMDDAWKHIFKVPFEEVAALVRGRQVFLQGGYAYVLSRDLDSIVSFSFCKRLNDKLDMYHRSQYEETMHDERERLAGLFNMVPEARVGSVYKVSDGKMKLDEVHDALNASAPLCMKSSYSVLLSDGHLKDNGRRQFGLFLKGIGVSMEDALLFWRKHFTHVDGERFDKQYAYNIRHQYGQEGKRTNYRPFDCSQVIGASPDTSGATGCPYRNHGTEKLKATLAKMGVAADVVKQVLAKKQENKYQEACTQVFRALYKESHVEDVVVHPNQYFIQSREKKSQAASEAAASVHVSQAASEAVDTRH